MQAFCQGVVVGFLVVGVLNSLWELCKQRGKHSDGFFFLLSVFWAIVWIVIILTFWGAGTFSKLIGG